MNCIHIRLPYATRIRIACKAIHFPRIITAHPDACRVVSRISDKPAIFLTRCGTGLACRNRIGQLHLPSGTLRHNALEHIRHYPCSIGIIHALFFRLFSDQHASLCIRNHYDAAWLPIDSVICKRCKPGRHLHRTDSVGEASERHRRYIVRIHNTGKIHIQKILQSVLDTKLQKQLPRYNIRGLLYCTSHRNLPRVRIAGILRPTLKILIQHHIFRQPSSLEQRCIDEERLYRTSCLPYRLVRTIQGIAGKFLHPSSDDGNHSAVFIVDTRRRAL